MPITWICPHFIQKYSARPELQCGQKPDFLFCPLSLLSIRKAMWQTKRRQFNWWTVLMHFPEQQTFCNFKGCLIWNHVFFCFLVSASSKIEHQNESSTKYDVGVDIETKIWNVVSNWGTFILHTYNQIDQEAITYTCCRCPLFCQPKCN